MLEIGKLDSKLLEDIVFDKIKYKRDEVTVRPGIGEDCAVVDFGNYDCIVSTDPITAAVEDIGKLAIHISCNDIASNGVSPLGIMLTVMLPIGTTKEDIEKIMEDAGNTAAELEVEIIGGHTEITNGVNKPIIVSTAIGRYEKEKKKNEKMEAGDSILMTKTSGIEGAGIIASDYGEELSEVLTNEEILEASNFLKRVSVVKEGVIGGNIGVCQMHDITEGGILGALWEVCTIGNIGAEISKKNIPITSLVKKICSHFNINPYRLISSGCMLIVCKKEKEKILINAINNAGIEVSKLGEIKDRPYGIRMDAKEIDPPSGDEIYKVVGK